MNKDFVRLFSVAILFFTALESKCENIQKYLQLIPGGKLRKCCENFPEDPGIRFLAKMIQFSLSETNRGSGSWGGEQDKPLNIAAYVAGEKAFLKRKTCDREKLNLPVDKDVHIVRGED